MKPTPEQIAVLLIAMVRRVGGKRGEGSRWRISEKTMRKVAHRAMLREAFIEALEDELALIGYLLIPLPQGGFGLIETKVFDSWPRISTRDRLDNEFAAIKAGNFTIFEKLVMDARAQFVPDPTDANDVSDEGE